MNVYLYLYMCCLLSASYVATHIVVISYQSIYVENTEVLPPPPYPSHLPSYEETLRLPSPMQLRLYNGQVFTKYVDIELYSQTVAVMKYIKNLYIK